MCGFAGFFNADARDMVCRALACPEPVEGLAMTTSPRHCEERSDVAIAMTELATRMAMAIVHRGSDDAGA